MKQSHKHRVIIFELKKENAEVIIRKKMSLATGQFYFQMSVKNWDGSYEISQLAWEGTHICKVIQAIRLMIIAARECNWDKYHPTVQNILELNTSRAN